jgi:hypothetical protein
MNIDFGNPALKDPINPMNMMKLSIINTNDMETSLTSLLLGIVGFFIGYVFITRLNKVCRLYERIVDDERWVMSPSEKAVRKRTDQKKKKKIMKQKVMAQL